MTTDLRSRVESRLADLSPVARRVALLLLSEHDRLGFHSAAELGRMAGTTDATVIRTVQQLGYRGVVELKAAVAAELTPDTPRQRLSRSVDADVDGPHDDLARMLDMQQRALTRLAEPHFLAAVTEAGRVVVGAQRVLVHARGISTGIAEHAAAQLTRIGLDARTLGSAAGLIGDDLARVRPTDVVLVVASGRQQPWHAALYDHCAEQRVRVVLVTDTHPAPAADALVLRVGRGDPHGLATHVGTIATVEALVLAAARADRPRATSALHELDRQRRRLAADT